MSAAVVALGRVGDTTFAPAVAPGASRGRADPALACVGLSFRTAPLALRERLSLDRDAIAALLHRVETGEVRPDGVQELVVLSTCSRLELYAIAADGASGRLVPLIEEATGVSEAELAPALYAFSHEAVARHLCRVAAGLDSIVVGEPQILGQVSDACAAALGQRVAGHALATLFRGAVVAGRRVRAETAVGRNAATLSSAAVRVAEDAVGDLAAASALVIGTGEMAELALAALHYRGARDVTVVSRTREHADGMAARFGHRAAPFEHLDDVLADADIAISATAAPHHVVTREMVHAAMTRRPARPLLLVDIALPRDVEPEAATVPGVRCFDLDDLQRSVAHGLAERAAEVPRAEAIAEEEAARCMAALRLLEVQPLIADLRSHVDQVRQDALAKALRRLDHLDAADRAQIAAFSEALVNRLFHQPTRRLRAEAERGSGAGYAMAMRHLFGLSE